MPLLSLACQKISKQLTLCSDLHEICSFLELNHYDLLIVEMDPEEFNALPFLEWLSTRTFQGYVVLTAAETFNDQFYRVLPFGVDETCLVFPLDESVWMARINQWLGHHDNLLAQSEIPGLTKLSDDLRSRSPLVRSALFDCLSRQNLNLPILIYGEPGVGKRYLLKVLAEELKESSLIELDAQNLEKKSHLDSLEKQIRDVVDVVDSEKAILFPLTVLIHEVGLLSQEAQEFLSTLLLQQILLLDGTHLPIAFRLLVSTTQDLKILADEMTFREDLYFCLKNHQVRLPALRERPEDIQLFVQHFLEKLSSDRPTPYLTQDALEVLQQQPWVGNVSELKKVLEQLVGQNDSRTLTALDLPPHFLAQSFYKEPQSRLEDGDLSYLDAKKSVLNKFHTVYIANLLGKSEQNITVAAEKAGMDRSNFKKMIRKYGFLS